MSSGADTVGPGPDAAVGDPQKLLSAANDSSGVARNTWLAFLGVLAYLLVTLGGITHADLLLNSPVRLPIVNVEIPLYGFFIVAPVLLVILHFNLLMQHALVAHKYLQFARAVARREVKDLRNDPDRFLVHNYVFAQLLAGPRRPWVIGLMMRMMIWLTLSAVPVATLVFIQIKFLPYHDEPATVWHQILISIDLVILLLVRSFILYPYLIEEPAYMFLTDVKKAFSYYLSIGDRPPTFRFFQLFFKEPRNAYNIYWPWRPGLGGLVRSLLISSVVLVFSFLVATVPESKWDKRLSGQPLLASTVITGNGDERPVFVLTKFFFERVGTSWPGRNLNVSGADLVPDQEREPNEPSISLRDRPLHYAVFAGADFHRADFQEAELYGAQLDQANLRGASLAHAYLQNASLVQADLRGADLAGAHLQGARMFGVNLQGAILTSSDLRGADLRWANLHGADLRGANLQAAILAGASLQGADLEGADFGSADARNTTIWRTTKPKAGAHLDVSGIKSATPDDDDVNDVLRALEGMKQVHYRVGRRFALFDASPGDFEVWSELIPREWIPTDHQKSNGPDRIELAKALSKIVCESRDGYVAQGVLRRSISDFNADISAFSISLAAVGNCLAELEIPQGLACSLFARAAGQRPDDLDTAWRLAELRAQLDCPS